MRRRLLFIFATLLAGLVVMVATLPWWLGRAAKWAGSSRGLTFETYERVGYSRFALGKAEYRRSGVVVTVARAEADTPVLWLWRHWRGSDNTIVASTWQVEVARNPQPKPPPADRGWVSLKILLQRIAVQLDRWLPRANVGAGVVRFPGGEIAVDAAKWANRELNVEGLAYRALKAVATVRFQDDHISLVMKTVDDAVAPLAAKLQSRGANVTGEISIWDQQAGLNATFAPRGWLPSDATFLAKAWSVPAEKLKLGQLYRVVQGSAEIEWRTERFVADIQAKGEPLPDKAAPPLEVVLRGNGDGQALRIDSLHATIPGITARLNETVTIERSGELREGAARFTLQADLAKQPWFSATGTVSGEARLVSGLAAAPVVEFSVDARDLTARDIALASLNASGRLDWPRLEIASARITGANGEQLGLRGGWNIRTREIFDAAVEGEIRRASVARWLPKQPEFDVVKIDAKASGPVAELKHTGRARADGVKSKGLNPLAISAEWNGTGANIEALTVEVMASTARIAASGSADRSSLRLTTLEFSQGGVARLHLAGPATLRWKPQLQIDSLHLTGAEGNLKVSAMGGESGRIEVSAREISSRWFAEIVPVTGPAWQLKLLALIGAWDRGPMKFSLTAGASLEIGEGRTAAVMAAARGDKDGVNVEALRATEGDDTVVNAVGRIPVLFTPGASTLMHFDADGPLLVDATVAPNSAFWQKLAAVSGIELKEPQASAHLTGTWRRPEGNATLKAARIAIDSKRVARPLPLIEALDVQLTGDPGGVTLTKFTVSVEGQAVRAQGRLPVPDGNWEQLLKEPLAAARRGADLRLEVPGAEVAVFTRFLPAVLAPKGQLQADLHYKNGGIEGFLKLRDAASRPLGPLGVLQEISADIALSGRKLALRGVTARSGGQPVTLAGTIELPENGAPRFDLTLRGENLPFVRQTGLLMRGDLDLKLQTPQNAPPRLSGTVRLRDSLFLADVRAFLPKGGGTNPLRRPPYFAIEAAPVNAWNLAVDVTGDEFLRLRTPVFTGVASARFRLNGTLGEPRAIGEIAIDRGSVRMPFANLEVTQGSVRLTEADPFEPAVYLRGTGRRYGYDLTVEIDGSASQPNVVFTSSPALDSEQVLLMVMTGAVPSTDFSNSSTKRLANIGYFLGQSLLESLGSDTGDTDRLTIASGEKITNEGEETLDIEYKLSDRWTLTGERNEFNEYTAGVKWRIFRGKRAGEEQEHAKK